MPILVQFIVLVLVLGVLWWAVTSIASAYGLPAQVTVVIQVLLVLIAVVWLLQLAGLLDTGWFGRAR